MPLVNLTYLEKFPSYQQEVHKVVWKGQKGYAKKIVSNYSWWMFEETDVFKREILSTSCMDSAQLFGILYFQQIAAICT